MVAGLTITASASFAHDIYANVIHHGKETSEGSEVRVARITAVVIGIVAILGGILALGQNIAFLVALAFAVAASANLPTILYSLYWRRFNTRGALWSMYGGLISCVTLIIFSPVVSGKPPAPGTTDSLSMIKDTSVDFHWFPLDNPGIVSIPLGLPPRLARHHDEQGALRGEVRRDGGPVAHRSGRREGHGALTGVPASLPDAPPGRGTP